MATETTVRRVNFKLATDSFAALQKLSTTSGCNMTELVETALALLSEAYATQEAGGQIILTSRDGQTSKAVQLPTKSLRTIVMMWGPGASFTSLATAGAGAAAAPRLDHGEELVEQGSEQG
jgi:hypothetical protein